MKLDKETIVKHHFWFLVCSAAVLTLLGWIILIVSAPSTVSVERTKVDKSLKDSQTVPPLKSPKAVLARQKEADNLKKERGNSHFKLYEAQDKAGALMTWPKQMEHKFNFKNGKFAVEVVIQPPKTKLSTLEPDNATRISGTLTGETDENSFTIIDRKKQSVSFLLTRDVKVSEKDKPKVTKDFGPLVNRKDSTVVVTFVTGKVFGDDLTVAEITDYTQTYNSYVKDVLRELFAQSVTQLRYTPEKGGFAGPKPDPKAASDIVNDAWVYQEDKLPPADNRFFSYVASWGDKPAEITSDEVWAAQENLWVQRELFKQIKVANDSLAVCEPVSKTMFRNYYWDVELSAAEGGIKAKLKNLRPRPQGIDTLRFLLRFKNASEPVLFPPKGTEFYGQPVKPGETFESTPFLMKDVNLADLQKVEQVLTVETAAVKRVDVVALGAAANGDTTVSHRQFTFPLRSFPRKQALAPIEIKVDPKAEPVKEAPRPRIESVSKTTRGVVLQRYLEVTGESRKLPVNLVLIVGPEHMARVQAALISSPLRFLETQVLWQRAQVPLGGTDPSAASKGGVADTGVVTQDLIELTIYGVVTLYQKP